MIAKVQRGRGVGRLLRYLFGPGEANEHTDPHVVASYAGGPESSAFLEPPTGPRGRRDVSELGERLTDLDLLTGSRKQAKPVWHVSVRVAPEDRRLTDDEWAQIATDLVTRAGLVDELGTGCPVGVPLLTGRGLSTTLAAWAIGLGGVGQVAGRRCYQPLVARLTARGRTAAVIGAGGLATFVLGIVPGPAFALVTVAVAVVVGASRGMFTLVEATLVADLWGAERFARLNGVFNAPLTAATALAPASARPSPRRWAAIRCCSSRSPPRADSARRSRSPRRPQPRDPPSPSPWSTAPTGTDSAEGAPSAVGALGGGAGPSRRGVALGAVRRRGSGPGLGAPAGRGGLPGVAAHDVPGPGRSRRDR